MRIKGEAGNSKTITFFFFFPLDDRFLDSTEQTKPNKQTQSNPTNQTQPNQTQRKPNPTNQTQSNPAKPNQNPTQLNLNQTQLNQIHHSLMAPLLHCSGDTQVLSSATGSLHPPIFSAELK